MPIIYGGIVWLSWPVRLEPPHLYDRDSERFIKWTAKGLKKMQQVSEEEKTWYEPFIDFTVVEEFPTEHAVESREYFAYPASMPDHIRAAFKPFDRHGCYNVGIVLQFLVRCLHLYQMAVKPH